MMTITDDDLDTWEKLANAATPGPWEADRFGFVIAKDWAPNPVVISNDALRNDDAAFVAMAREAMPRMIAELRMHRREMINLAKSHLADLEAEFDNPESDMHDDGSLFRRIEILRAVIGGVDE